MAFKGVIGFFSAAAVVVAMGINGTQEASKDNKPGETNMEQFFVGAAKTPVKIFKWAAKGLSESFSSDDVKETIESAEKAGSKITKGVKDYANSKGLNSPTDTVEVVPYVPEYIPEIKPQKSLRQDLPKQQEGASAPLPPQN